MNERTRYLSVATVAQKTAKQKMLMIGGGILTTFFAFGVVGGIFDYSEGLREGIPVYVVLMIPGLLLLYRGFAIGRQIGTARRYETIFRPTVTEWCRSASSSDRSEAWRPRFLWNWKSCLEPATL